MEEQLSISLASDITYIYGTVNGSEATFSLSASNTWSTTVPKSTDGKYEVSITAYDDAGNSTLYNTTIYKLDSMMEPKTDWTKDDYYNAEDLNRIEINTQFLAEYLVKIQYPSISLETVKTDRDMTSIDFISSINNRLQHQNNKY